MRDRAEAVVVGGGVQGAAMALHLLRAGIGHVRLLERDGLFEATSPAGAGFVAIWAAVSPRPYGEEEVAVEQYGLTFYRDLQDQGHDVHFVQNGFLLVAASESALEHLQAIYRKEFDPDTVMVDRTRIEELSGGAILADGVFGGLFQPAGSQVFTPKVGKALTACIVDAGGTIEPGRPAMGLQIHRGRVTGVQTRIGVVECDTVVLAAGAWNNELLRPLGVYLPFVPQLTSRIITEPLGISSTMPAVMLSGVTPDGPRLWIREHEGRLLWGGVYMTYPRDSLIGVRHLPTRFDEIPIDGVLECQRVARAAARLMPALGRYKSMKLKHGAPCYTPDCRALVGPVPGVEGLYTMAGDNEAGITHGPGFAKVLADYIVDGSSELTNLDAWKVDRFNGWYTTDAEVAEAVNAALTGGMAR